PIISNILCLLFSPETYDTADRGTAKNFATNSTAALLALPSIGGAVSRSSHSSLRLPENSEFFAFGMTRTLSRAVKSGLRTERFRHAPWLHLLRSQLRNRDSSPSKDPAVSIYPPGYAAVQSKVDCSQHL